MRGTQTYRLARILASGHAFVQNFRRRHYEIATDVPPQHRLRTAFHELTLTMQRADRPPFKGARDPAMQQSPSGFWAAADTARAASHQRGRVMGSRGWRRDGSDWER